MENKTINFTLLKITTEQFAIIENSYKENSTLSLQASIDFKANIDSKLIACFTRFQLLCENAPFIVMNLKCEFAIKEDSWNSFIDKENNAIKFPKGLMSHLAVITVGTSRGVLHAKTEPTKFNRFHLPTINVNDFVREDIVFPLNNK
jgi:hypothetical protein